MSLEIFLNLSHFADGNIFRAVAPSLPSLKIADGSGSRLPENGERAFLHVLDVCDFLKDAFWSDF